VERHKLHKLDDREFYPLVGSEVDDFKFNFEELKDRAEAYWLDPSKSEWYAGDVIKVRDMVPHLRELLRYYVRLDSKPSGSVPQYLVREFSSLSDNIFSVASKYNQGKWKKAVGILFDQLEPYLNPRTWKKALGDLSIQVTST
jgi:hypothetical protein